MILSTSCAFDLLQTFRSEFHQVTVGVRASCKAYNPAMNIFGTFHCTRWRVSIIKCLEQHPMSIRPVLAAALIDSHWRNWMYEIAHAEART